MFNHYMSALMALMCCVSLLVADGSHSKPIDHAPIGVMGDHMHAKGEWMLSYRLMHMEMDGNRHKTSRLSVDEVTSRTSFMMIPKQMPMTMHMLGAMYGWSDTMTIAVMAPYLSTVMDIERKAQGDTFETRSQGLGDVRATALIRLLETDTHHVHANAGLSIPVGSINQKDDTPMGADTVLAYPMQLGSGTWDLLPGITYTHSQGHRSWGAQASAVLRLGENSEGYRLGDQASVTTWVQRQLNASVSHSLRLTGQTWDDIHGRDLRLATMAPTADPDRREGTRVDVSYGVNTLINSGILAGNRLAAEVGVPVYQWLSGPQLETDWWITVGWQKTL